MKNIQIIVLTLLGVLVIMGVLTTVYSLRTMMAIDKCPCPAGVSSGSAYASRAASYMEPIVADLQSQKRGVEGRDKGKCAQACGEACMGRDDVPITEHCARKCAAACGFDFS